MAEAKGVSLSPETYGEGGLLDDLDVAFSKSRFEMWDYNKKVAVPVPALLIDFLDPESGEDVADGKSAWSAGKKEDWMPSGDGTCLIPIGNSTAINKKSNLALFLISLCNAGFPPEKLEEGDISVLDGVVAHVNRVAAPKRAGMAPKAPRADGREFEQTVLVVTSIVSLPWDEKKGKRKKAASGKGATAKGKATGKKSADTDTGDDEAQGVVDVAETATAIMLSLLSDAGKEGILKKALPTAAFKHPDLKVDPSLRNAVCELVFQDDFLNSGPWVYKDDKVSMG